MDVTPIAVAAAVWGAATGLLVPRAAYRLSVQPEEEWRAACPRGHALTGPAAGWLGPARCAPCTAGSPAPGLTKPAARAEPAGLVGPAGPVRLGAPGRPEEADRPDGPDRDDETDQDHRPYRDDETDRDHRPHQADDPDDPGEPPARPVPYRTSAAVPAVTALVCLLLGYATGPRPELAVWLLAAPFAVLLALVDRNVHRLPDQLTLPLAGASALLLGAAELAPGDGGSWPTALLGGLALGGVYFLLFLINPNGMGFGDVKLALSLGVVLGWYGWTVLFAGAFAGFLLGSVYGVGLMLLRRANRRTAIPFGPFMITGAFLGLLLGALAAA